MLFSKIVYILFNNQAQRNHLKDQGFHFKDFDYILFMD